MEDTGGREEEEDAIGGKAETRGAEKEVDGIDGKTGEGDSTAEGLIFGEDLRQGVRLARDLEVKGDKANAKGAENAGGIYPSQEQKSEELKQ